MKRVRPNVYGSYPFFPPQDVMWVFSGHSPLSSWWWSCLLNHNIFYCCLWVTALINPPIPPFPSVIPAQVSPCLEGTQVGSCSHIPPLLTFFPTPTSRVLVFLILNLCCPAIVNHSLDRSQVVPLDSNQSLFSTLTIIASQLHPFFRCCVMIGK